MKFTFLKPLVVATSLFAATCANAGLIGFYELNGSGVEKTGKGPDLTEEKGAVNYVDGLDGLAASFDGSGNSFLRAAIDSSGNRVPNFSWGAWVKLNDPSAWNIFLSNDNYGWDRFTQAEDGFWSVSKDRVVNSPIATTTDWTFIAQTFDGVTQKLYVDDNPVFSFDDGKNNSQSFIDIGRNANGAYPLNGLMDGVFFFDQTLTSKQVATIRDGGADGSGALAVVPEPSTIAILALGLMGLASRRFKKQA